MFRKLAVIFFISIFTHSYGQNKVDNSLSVLIYSEGEGFLQPYIETTLKNLSNTDTNKKYFKSVNSFNRFISDNKYQAELSDLIGTQRPENEKLSLYYTNSEKEIRKRIFDILKDYKYFLTVNTNTLGELIEFQFQLYETVNSGNNVPYNISDKVINVQNFFINPKESSYKFQIKNALQSLFEKSNKPPIPSISIYGNKIENNDTIIVSKNTVVQIDARDSGDYDSEKIIYKWRNIPNSNEKYQTFNKLEFKDSLPILILNINKDGPFNLGFKVHDGINESEEINFTLITKKKPLKIQIQDTSFFDIVLRPKWFKNRKSDFLHEIHIQDNDSTSLVWENVIYSNKPLGTKVVAKDIDNSIDTLKLEFPKYDRNQIMNNLLISNLSIKNNKLYEESYIYRTSKDSLLSDPTTIIHRVKPRQGFTFRFYQSLTSLNNVEYYSSTENPNDTLRGGIVSNLIKIGGYLNDHLEIGLAFPLKKREEFIYRNLRFQYPEVYSIFIYYHAVLSANFIGIYGGLNTNLLNYRKLDEELYHPFIGLSPEFGVNCRIISVKYFDLKIFMGAKFNTFQNNKFSSIKGSFSVETGFQIDI